MYGLACLLGDAPRAEEALRSYHWGGQPLPLYPEAGLAGAPSPVVAYSRFCRRVKEIADEHYRLSAIGKTKAPHQSLREPVLAEARKFWPEITSEEALRKELSARFDAVISFERWGLEFGRRVLDEERVFEQYGRTARVRFVVVDSMVSNGYVSWLSDGRSIIGGWAGPPMTQVRREDALRGSWSAVLSRISWRPSKPRALRAPSSAWRSWPSPSANWCPAFRRTRPGASSTAAAPRVRNAR